VALHWFVMLLLSVGAIFEIKSFFFSQRPSGILNFQQDSSFPSGHTTLSIALFGFWSVIVARELKFSRRWFPYLCSGIIAAAIILSRLYLGAHWLTDVFGSILLALVLVLVLTISYRRRHSHHAARFSLLGFIAISICALLISWFSYCVYKYPQSLKDYTLSWPVVTITQQSWSNEVGKSIPLYRTNRIGEPIQAFNVEWLGSLDEIEKILLQHGWEKQPTVLGLQGTALFVIGDATAKHFALFPQLYHNRSAVLFMIKKTKQDNVALVLRLWQSDIKLENKANLPLWLGVVEYHYAKQKLFKLSKSDKKYPRFVGAVNELEGYDENFKLQEVTIPSERQTPEMQDLNWDGEVFLVQSK